MNRSIIVAAAIVIVGGAAFYALGPLPPFWVNAGIKTSLTKWTTDPESLQLAGLRYSTIDRDFVCGSINAKNALGAYTGFKTFAHSQKQKFTFIEGIDPSADTMISLFRCGDV